MTTDPFSDSGAGAPLFVGLGELIWDMLPEGRRLGGAPTNFAYVARLLGNRSAVASRVGDDALGREARARLEAAGVSTEYVQVENVHPTGTVGVRIGERGEPAFTVNGNSAWDYLEWTERWEELAARADCVCFGTLGQREARARGTILRFLEGVRPEALRVFDVNLRHSFFTPEMLARSLAHASVAKLNVDELRLAASMLDLRGGGERALAEDLLARFGLDLVAVTRGERGSLLVSAGGASEHAGFRVEVADTIGSGDAFAAALAHCRLRGASLEVSNDTANRVGSWVATQPGATPEADAATVARLLEGL
ncbi:MAG TPA: carbohydrate kinase [Pyrinomonadaceae bacterium]|jgi:fructokinase|nr:carbohydrate kinase [Pyrinomonadaceae bacterium]